MISISIDSKRSYLFRAGFTLALKDGQKSRSVRSLSVHASAAPVHELSELRSRPNLWQRVHAARLSPAQRELVVELEPPITASCVKVCISVVHSAKQ
jgi:hypothetical protein